MKATGKRRLQVLAVASVLATIGIVWLAVKAAGRSPDWAMAAAGSPLAVRCLVLIGGGLAALGLLAALLIRVRPAKGRPRRELHADQGGTAAIEMAFVFPLALMIFLMVTQAALLFNANMVVHHAAFAAARVATVVVPMPIGDERLNLVWPPDSADSTKLALIRQAAVLALLPISAKLDQPTGGGGFGVLLPDIGDAVKSQTQGAFSYGGAEDQPWFRRIKKQFNYANGYGTDASGNLPITQIELAPPDHWQDGNPDPDCPYRELEQGEWGDWGWTYPPYCGYSRRVPPIWDFWYWEELDIRLTYQFLLEVPYACRFLGEEIQMSGLEGKNYTAEIQVVERLTNEGHPELPPRDAPPGT